MYTPARPQMRPSGASQSFRTPENALQDRPGVHALTQEQGRPGHLNNDIIIALMPSNNSISSPESTLHSPHTPEQFRAFQGSPSNTRISRPGSTTLQAADCSPLYNSYYCQYQGLGINMGAHLPHNLGHVSCHVPPYNTNNDSSYVQQGDGTEGVY